jgi:hypothetical protein
MPQHCWAVSRSFDYVDDLLWHSMMDQVSDTLNQPQDAVRNVLMEPDNTTSPFGLCLSRRYKFQGRATRIISALTDGDRR